MKRERWSSDLRFRLESEKGSASEGEMPTSDGGGLNTDRHDCLHEPWDQICETAVAFSQEARQN